MNIAIVTYALQVGGVEAVIRDLADYFKLQGNQVTILETLEVGRWSDAFRTQGFDVQPLLAKSIESRRQHAQRLACVLREFDVVLLNDAPFGQSVLGCLDENAIAIPILHSSVTPMVHNACANENNWDMLVAVSPGVMESAIYYGADRAFVTCIPNGVSVPNSWPKASLAGDGQSPLRAVFLGAISHRQKGVFHLLGILRNALNQGAHVHLDVIGDGEDFEQLKVSFELELERRNVALHGSMANEEAKRILANADILLMPSYFEGLPIVLLEAMAAGVVPIVSKLSGCTDFVISQGEDGYLIEKGSEIEFANAIVNLDQDRQLLGRLSERAWRTAANRFGLEQMGKAYLELIKASQTKRIAGHATARSRKIETRLLGDLSWMPLPFVRPVRKLLRMLGVLPQPVPEPLLVEPPQ